MKKRTKLLILCAAFVIVCLASLLATVTGWCWITRDMHDPGKWWADIPVRMATIMQFALALVGALAFCAVLDMPKRGDE